jgi:putative transposase
MLILDYKLRANKQQQGAIDEAIRTVQFIRNKCLRKWMDGRGISDNDLQIYCAQLAQEYPFAARLNSQARQTSADRAWLAIARFYKNCRDKKPGKKGYPRFQKDNRSVEYKATSGWKLEPDGEHLTFRDGYEIGKLKLIGTRSIETFPLPQIKRVRLLKRAAGYYVQFAVKADRNIQHVPTGREVGIDVGLKTYYPASDGQTVENPRLFRKGEKNLKRLHRRRSGKKQGSKNRQKARRRLAKAYLKVQRPRKDFACKTARALVQSSDLVAYEDLPIRSLARNRKLAKSIMDASWGLFLRWVRYYGMIHGIPVVAVSPNYTTQDCFGCGCRVKKSLCIRTHVCPSCGLIMDRELLCCPEHSFSRIPYPGTLGNGQSTGLCTTLGDRCTEAFSSQDDAVSAPERTKNPLDLSRVSVNVTDALADSGGGRLPSHRRLLLLYCTRKPGDGLPAREWRQCGCRSRQPRRSTPDIHPAS